MPFGASSQKFTMGGLGFEGQQGMGSAAGGLMGNEMVTYTLFFRSSVVNSLYLSFLFAGETIGSF